MRRELCVGALLVLSATAIGCGVEQKKSLVETALSGNDGRTQYFEAILRILDQKPEYVDELFRMAHDHPKTLDRFLEITAKDLADEDLARRTAAFLAQNPKSLHQILVRTLEAAKHDRAARQAIATAIEDRMNISTETLVERPSAMRASFESMVDAVSSQPAAQRAFLQSMEQTSPEIARVLASNPHTLMVLTKALLRVAFTSSKAELKTYLFQLGI